MSSVWDMYFVIRGVRIFPDHRVGRNGAYTVDFTLNLSWKCLHEPACTGMIDISVEMIPMQATTRLRVCFPSRPQHSSELFFLFFFFFSFLFQWFGKGLFNWTNYVEYLDTVHPQSEMFSLPPGPPVTLELRKNPHARQHRNCILISAVL